MTKLSTPAEQALEKRRAYQRKYYKSHKARARKYYRANQEKIRLRAAQWRKDNRKRYLMQQAMYDLTQRGNMFPEDRIRRAYKWLYELQSSSQFIDEEVCEYCRNPSKPFYDLELKAEICPLCKAYYKPHFQLKRVSEG